MLRVDRKQKRFVRLEQRRLPVAGLTERNDLLCMIRQSPDAFFAELGEAHLLLGEEVRPTDFVDDRIDLLAVDKRGAVVVVELKRSSHKLHLLQALSYAGMIAKWEHEQLLAVRGQFASGDSEAEDSEDDADEALPLTDTEWRPER